jgi:hypothetical protein
LACYFPFFERFFIFSGPVGISGDIAPKSGFFNTLLIEREAKKASAIETQGFVRGISLEIDNIKANLVGIWI